MLHKLRRAMEQSGRERLHGEVEFDETYVGGVEEGAGGRSRGKKQPVAVACERVSETTMDRIRLARLPDVSALAIADFLEQNVEPGSILVSDNWTSYVAALDELAKRGLAYEHRPTTLRGNSEKAHRVHPHVHRVAALLKRWMLGTHQGAITDEYLDAYSAILLSSGQNALVTGGVLCGGRWRHTDREGGRKSGNRANMGVTGSRAGGVGAQLPRW